MVVDMAAAGTLVAEDFMEAGLGFTEVVADSEEAVVTVGPIEASEELAQSGVSVETAGFTAVAAFTVGVVDIPSLQFRAKDSSVDQPDRVIPLEVKSSVSSTCQTVALLKRGPVLAKLALLPWELPPEQWRCITLLRADL